MMTLESIILQTFQTKPMSTFVCILGKRSAKILLLSLGKNNCAHQYSQIHHSFYDLESKLYMTPGIYPVLLPELFASESGLFVRSLSHLQALI